MKAELLSKMKKQKLEMMKAIKKADNNTENDKNRYQLLEDAIKRLEHLLNGKADIDSLKKMVGHLENKINYVFHMMTSDSEEDAIIAKKNWFCLSCDKKLENYRGRIGGHLTNSSMLKGEGLKQEIMGGGMMIRSKSKVDLPKVQGKIK